MATTNLLRGDSISDQIMAELRSGALSDIDEWARIARKVNDAAATRGKCKVTTWTDEEMYQLVRLAHGAAAIVTGRLLGRDV